MKTSSSFLLATGSVVVLLAAACGGSVETTSQGQGGAGSTTGTSSSGTGAGGNPCYPDSCTGPSSSSSSSGAGGAGPMCGGFGGATCPPDSFCDFPSDNCGGDDGTGTCLAKPSACPELYIPTCGCDGVVYDSPCMANGAGVDVSNFGGCAAPAGTFACGWTFCGFDQYCQRSVSDVGGSPDYYTCMWMPPECQMGQPPSCACLAQQACGDMCVQDAAGGMTVTCPGG